VAVSRLSTVASCGEGGPLTENDAT